MEALGFGRAIGTTGIAFLLLLYTVINPAGGVWRRRGYICTYSLQGIRSSIVKSR